MLGFRVPGLFFNKLARIDGLAYPQDAGGGELPDPQAVAVLVSCAVQTTGEPEPIEGGSQFRRGSSTKLAIFFRPCDVPQAVAVQALGQNDRVQVDGYSNPLILDGPPSDKAGRGAIWEAAARDIR